MSIHKSYRWFFIPLFLNACAAQNESILPVQPARANAEENYKQCVAMATTRLMSTNLSADTVVRDSMEHCRGLRYSMLNAYPKHWRDSYARQLDAEVYQSQLSLIYQAQQSSGSE